MAFILKDYNFEKLKPYESKLYTALYGDFIRDVSREAKMAMEEVYEDHFGYNGNILGGCNRCVINAMKRLAKLYFPDKQAREEEAEQAKKIEEVVELELEKKEEVVELEPEKEEVPFRQEPKRQNVNNKAVAKSTPKKAANKK